MILPIVQYGHPVLRQKCRAIESVTPEITQLAADMLETMTEARGVGLAAPQIGQDLQLAVIDVSYDPECVSFFHVNGQAAELIDHMPLVFINPTLEYGAEKDYDVEGCLSIKGLRAEVRRPDSVKATLTMLDGSTIIIESDGLLARALQHEIDHLNGVLFTDRLAPVMKVRIKGRLKKILEENGY